VVSKVTEALLRVLMHMLVGFLKWTMVLSDLVLIFAFGSV